MPCSSSVPCSLQRLPYTEHLYFLFVADLLDKAVDIPSVAAAAAADDLFLEDSDSSQSDPCLGIVELELLLRYIAESIEDDDSLFAVVTAVDLVTAITVCIRMYPWIKIWLLLVLASSSIVAKSAVTDSCFGYRGHQLRPEQ
jgi:hypothetical protein